MVSDDELDVSAAVARVGRRIAELRRAAGLTQERLAEAIGVDPRTVQALERGAGNPPLRTLLALALSLGVPPGELFAVPVTPRGGPGRPRASAARKPR